MCVCVGGERGVEEWGVGKRAVNVLQLPKLIVKILEMRNLYKIFPNEAMYTIHYPICVQFLLLLREEHHCF